MSRLFPKVLWLYGRDQATFLVPAINDRECPNTFVPELYSLRDSNKCMMRNQYFLLHCWVATRSLCCSSAPHCVLILTAYCTISPHLLTSPAGYATASLCLPLYLHLATKLHS